ncbi:hypothetical protein [Emticicia soli]|uniref:BIG2 domain-containing protein n=1 Tax=Emticicia soli TaxID=2027878 RepID=A0ABW5J9S6_9BACT
MLRKFTFLALIAVSCAKDDNSPLVISDVEINLKYDKQHQYSIKRGNKTLDNSAVKWELNDKNLGTMGTDGLFKARKVGTSHVNVTYNGALAQGNINVTPYSNLFTEPIMKFGSSMSDIKYLEKRKKIAETNNGIMYEGENSKIQRVAYVFDNDKLITALVIFKSTTAVAEEAGLFYKERYPKVVIGDPYIIFVDDDKIKIVGIGVDDDYGLVAIYARSDAGLRTNSSKALTEKHRKVINELKAKLASSK